jgi:hypothetical protein
MVCWVFISFFFLLSEIQARFFTYQFFIYKCNTAVASTSSLDEKSGEEIYIWKEGISYEVLFRNVEQVV